MFYMLKCQPLNISVYSNDSWTWLKLHEFICRLNNRSVHQIHKCVE